MQHYIRAIMQQYIRSINQHIAGGCIVGVRTLFYYDKLSWLVGLMDHRTLL